MADTRTMAQLLQEPTEGYEDAILIPEIVANNFELKHGLINLVQNKQFFAQWRILYFGILPISMDMSMRVFFVMTEELFVLDKID
ncbi:hypothetical protein Tco_0235468 [Tanacetum coccineum]